MDLFTQPLEEIRIICDQFKGDITSVHMAEPDGTLWPKAEGNAFVMKQETAVELGNPQTDSVSLAIWSTKQHNSGTGKITVYGPDLSDYQGKMAPFGQIVILGISDNHEHDDYQIYRALEEVKYKLNLKGYMRRGASQFMREWSRVSNEALESGFSLQVLGQELSNLYTETPYVESVEIILTTDGSMIQKLKPAAKQASRIIAAMNKMLNEEFSDCDNCDYSDICSQVTELQKLKSKKEAKRQDEN